MPRTRMGKRGKEPAGQQYTQRRDARRAVFGARFSPLHPPRDRSCPRERRGELRLKAVGTRLCGGRRPRSMGPRTRQWPFGLQGLAQVAILNDCRK